MNLILSIVWVGNIMNISQLTSDLDSDGFVRIPSFVDTNYCLSILSSIRDSISSKASPFFRDLDDNIPGSFYSDIWSSHFVSDFYSGYVPSHLPSLMSTLMCRQSVLLLQDTWFQRSSLCTTSIPWHHDQSIEGPFYSIWISLSDIPASASLRFVRGSHKSGLRYLPSAFFTDSSKNSQLGAMEEFYRSFHYSDSLDYIQHFSPVPNDIETNSEYDIQSVSTSAGDAIVFNGLTLHSLPPSSNVDSTGFVLRWISDDSVVSPYSNDAKIASELLNINLIPEQPIRDPFFKRFDF